MGGGEGARGWVWQGRGLRGVTGHGAVQHGLHTWQQGRSSTAAIMLGALSTLRCAGCRFVRMAVLAVIASKHINGVAAIHSGEHC